MEGVRRLSWSGSGAVSVDDEWVLHTLLSVRSEKNFFFSGVSGLANILE